MKKSFIIIIVVLIILALGFVGSKLLSKKSEENGPCKNDKNCQEGLKCVNNLCSSGKVDSYCVQKENCLTGFCVKNKCTEGKEGAPCEIDKDCKDSLCENSVCWGISEKPDQAKANEYISRSFLAKLSAGQQFDPSAIIRTRIFLYTDQFCTSLDLKKDIPAGNLAIAVYDKQNNEYISPKAPFPMELKQGNSTGCQNNTFPAGRYEQKMYIDDVLVIVLPFEVQ